jgi:ketol-acid reductoisomerase
MNIEMKAIFLSLAAAGLMLPAMAQSSDSGALSKPATINQRKENQQDRIANGIQSGELTSGEAAKLEKKESELNQEERDMRKLDNGHLSKADRTTLNQQQNQLSKDIYKQKHDAQVQNTNPKSEVGERDAINRSASPKA